MNRRRFLQTVAWSAAGVAGYQALWGCAAEARSRVVVVRGLGGAAEASPSRVQEAVQAAVQRLTGRRDGWKRLFRPDEVVGIKVNCVCEALPTHLVVVQALIAGLRTAGVKENRILIFDRRDQDLALHGGFTLHRGRRGVRCFGCKDGLGSGQEFQGFEREGRRFDLTSLLTEVCTALVNVPVLKDHSMTGVTLSLKNHFGSLRDALRHHGPTLQCDPQIAQLNSLPPIREKTRLIVLDALTGMYDGGPFGPGRQWDCGQILVSADPVALDTVGWSLLNARREAGKLPPIPFPAHLRTAGRSPYHLGVNDLQRIEVVEV
jgi:uncharacterized protein (DUF362 family)